MKIFIQVSVDLSDGMLAFWNILYENVLLEFMFVNKLKWAVPHLEVKRGRESEVVEGRESEVVEGRESEVVVGNYEVEGHTNIMKDVIKKIEMVKKTEINYDTKNNCTTLDNDRNNQDKKHNAIVYQKPHEYLPLSLSHCNEILLPLGVKFILFFLPFIIILFYFLFFILIYYKMSFY